MDPLATPDQASILNSFLEKITIDDSKIQTLFDKNHTIMTDRKQNFIIPSHSALKNNQVDRFIPSRKGSKLSIALTMAHESDPNHPKALEKSGMNNENHNYLTDMYKSHILGLNSSQKNPNIFIYNTEQQKRSVLDR
jgi:hypothetical protein